MRGRLLLAALAGAGLVLLCGGLTPPPAYAQDDPAAESDPNSGGADSADTAPAADDTAQPSAETPAAPPTELTAPSPEPTPIVASIRAKLHGPDACQECKRAGPRRDHRLLRRAQRSDLDDDMGFSSEAQSAIDEVLRADDWGLSSADFQLPPAGDLPELHRRTGLERDQARSRYSEICALRPRRQDRPGQLSKLSA